MFRGVENGYDSLRGLPCILFLTLLTLWAGGCGKFSQTELQRIKENSPPDLNLKIASLVSSMAADTGEQVIPELVRMGQPSLPALLAALRGESPILRDRAAVALWRMGDTAAPAVPELMDALEDDLFEVREYAIMALGTIGPKAAPAVSKLAGILKGKTNRFLTGFTGYEFDILQERAATALGKVGLPAVSALLEAWKSEDWKVRSYATSALFGIGPSVIPALSDALKEKNPAVRAAAANLMGSFGDAAAASIPALIDVLADASAGVAGSAVEALSRIGDPAVPALLNALSHNNRQVRIYSAITLWNMGGRVSRAQAVLEQARSAGSEIERATAESAFAANKDSPRHPSAAALVETLKEPDPELRRYALSAIRNLRFIPPESVQNLKEALKDENVEIRRLAAQMLYQTRQSEMISLMLQNLKDSDTSVRQSLTGALFNMALPSHWDISTLLPYLKSDDEKVRMPAAQLLYRAADTALLPHLSTLLYLSKAEGVPSSSFISYALRNLCHRVNLPIPTLVQILRQGGPSAKGGALEALERRSAEADSSVVQALLELFREKSYTSERSVRILRDMGDKALPDILHVLKTERDPEIRRYATQILMERGVTADLIPMDVLTKLSGDENLEIRSWAIDRIVRHNAARSTFPTLSQKLRLQKLRDEHTNFEGLVITTIAQGVVISRVSRMGDTGVKKLLQALDSDSPLMRLRASVDLIHQGVKSNEIWDALSEAAVHTDTHLRTSAVSALVQYADTRHVDLLIACLDEPVKSYRQCVVRALISLGRTAVPNLRSALNSRRKYIRFRAALILDRLGAGGSDLLPVLMEAIRDASEQMRASAACALGNLKSQAASAVPTLLESLKDTSPGVRLCAVTALRKIGASTPAVIQALKAAVEDKDRRVREAALNVLISLGEEIEGVIVERE